MARAIVLGCAGYEVGASETAFFREADPLGFILFARNCDHPDQVRALVDSLRESVGRADAPVLIDQEGGRVARLKPPHWRAAPPPARFGDLAERDPERAVRAAWINARLLAADLAPLGITVDCTPLLDLRLPQTHGVIGDRAFGADPARVAALGRAVCDGLMAGGVAPVVKHLPGHGRARVDSHEALPEVNTDAARLAETDFAPFAALRDAPWGMTAHVVYTAFDPRWPATVSASVVAEVIRRRIGFDGVLISDDVSMQALDGDLRARTAGALAAGCDVALHCNGDLAEMEQVAAAAGTLAPAAEARLDRAARALAAARDTHVAGGVDGEALRAELDDLLTL